MGPVINQKSFKYTLQRCLVWHILKQHEAAILEIYDSKVGSKEKSGKKFDMHTHLSSSLGEEGVKNFRKIFAGGSQTF